MSVFQESTFLLSHIPKRPSRQSGRSQSYRKFVLMLPSAPPPIPVEATGQLEQPSTPPKHSSKQHAQVDNRSLLSDMATIKSEAVKPQEAFKRKKNSITYSAVINARSPGKSGFFSKVTSFFLK